MAHVESGEELLSTALGHAPLRGGAVCSLMGKQAAGADIALGVEDGIAVVAPIVGEDNHVVVGNIIEGMVYAGAGYGEPAAIGLHYRLLYPEHGACSITLSIIVRVGGRLGVGSQAADYD